MSLLKVKSLLLGVFIIFASLISHSTLSAEPVKFEVISEKKAIQEGSPFWVALDLSLDEGWHAYWKNPGDAGMPPQITWTLPESFVVEEVEWPSPHRYVTEGAESYGYEGKTVLLAKIVPGQKVQNGPVKLKVDLRWVLCNSETCLPGSSEYMLELPVETEAAPAADKAAYFQEARSKLPKKVATLHKKSKETVTECVVDLKETFAADKEAYFLPEKGRGQVALSPHPESPSYAVLTFDPSLQESSKGILVVGDVGYDVDLGNEASLIAMVDPVENHFSHDDEIDSFGMALLFAFVGGMLLNLMPCVLPVISLKVLSFVQLAGKNRFETLKHGLTFSLGVLVSFWALALVLLVLQAWGRAVGWGFQLQEPLFVAILAAIVVVFAMSLFGVFEMGTLVASWAGEKQVSRGEGPLSSFFSGVLATAIATPCTGPFLGSAVGYAFTLPPAASMAVFTSLGLGMAFPYLALTAFPSFLKFVPKPGRWMETFKQAMGFMMLLAALWLTWVFSGETTGPALILLLAAFLAIGLSCWILGNWAVPYRSKNSRIFGWTTGLVCALFAAQCIWTASDFGYQGGAATEIAALDGEWEPFSSERLEALRAEGKPVFVDFTAKWCLICQTNHMVLATSDVAAKMKEKGVVKMKADWTNNDPEITKELQKWGRRSVPLYLLYSESAPKVLPQVLTPGNVMAELEAMK